MAHVYDNRQYRFDNVQEPRERSEKTPLRSGRVWHTVVVTVFSNVCSHPFPRDDRDPRRDHRYYIAPHAIRLGATFRGAAAVT